MIRIAIIEDNALFMHSLATSLGAHPEIKVIAKCTSPHDILQSDVCNELDVCLVDINLESNIDGIEFIARAKYLNPNIMFLVLTVFEDHETVFKALTAGALGYILKSSSKSEIIQAIFDIYNGGSPMTQSIARKIVTSFSKPSSRKESDDLTTREKEVLDWIAKGKLEKEVADILGISLKTVKNHISNIYAKLQVHTRVEALNKFFGRY